MKDNTDVELVSFRVRGYKNFVDSGEIDADLEATVLVGKNEAGKSTLLDALWRLNPANVPPTGFDLVQDYPRWLKKKHDTDGTSGRYPPIEATFRLSETALGKLQDLFGADVVTAQIFKAARYYDNDELVISVSVDNAAWVRSLAADHPDIWPEPTAVSTTDELSAALDAVDEELNAATAQLDPEKAATEPAEQAVTAGEEESDRDDDSDLTAQRVAIEARRAAYAAAKEALAAATDMQVEAQVAEALRPLVPKFFYFDDVYLLPGVVSIEKITDAVTTGNEEGLDEPKIAAARFLRSVRLKPDNLDPDNSERLKTELEAIGVELTNQVQAFWKQNPHVEFNMFPENVEEDHPQGGGKKIVDRQLEFRVRDSRHQASTPFTARSTGFRWFVSFLAQFAHYAEGRKDVIVLLDEPGVSLHAAAQEDLLGYIDDQLVPNQQVLYTTHSAWMVPVRKIHRVRTVEEDLNPSISTGATVSGRMLAKDRDTLMPLQAALGYDIAQTLFIGPDSLVVEGISEILYLYDMSDLLRTEGRASLDPRWHVCPAGSVGRIPAMLGLLGNSVDTTVLIDSPANPTERGNIEVRLYDQARLIEIADITGENEGDIEDLIGVEDYLAAFNVCFGTDLAAADLTSQAPRITQRIEHKHGGYNHGDVARAWVQERAAGRLKVSDETKNMFGTLFERINKTLSDAPAPKQPNPALAIFDQQLVDGIITQEGHAEIIRSLGVDGATH